MGSQWLLVSSSLEEAKCAGLFSTSRNPRALAHVVASVVTAGLDLCADVQGRSFWRSRAWITPPGGCGRTTWLFASWLSSSSPSRISSCVSSGSSPRAQVPAAIGAQKSQCGWYAIQLRNMFILLCLKKKKCFPCYNNAIRTSICSLIMQHMYVKKDFCMSV